MMMKPILAEKYIIAMSAVDNKLARFECSLSYLKNDAKR